MAIVMGGVMVVVMGMGMGMVVTTATLTGPRSTCDGGLFG